MIRLEQLSKTFHPGEATEVKALKDVNLSFMNGDYTVVVGANGSGKSTLLHLIAGSYRADEGRIFFDEEEVSNKEEHQRSPYIARLFQNPMTGTAPDLSILENFRLASLRTSSKKLTNGITGSFRQRVADSISRLGMGLENKLSLPMGHLSGGQRQALTLLMSTMDDCRLLLMDEPTSALDPRSAELIMKLSDDLIREKSLTAVLVTHRLKDGLAYGNRIILMQEGSIAKDLRDPEKQSLRLQDLYSWFGDY